MYVGLRRALVVADYPRERPTDKGRNQSIFIEQTAMITSNIDM